MPVKKAYTDIDEHAAQMSGFDQRYVQLSPGPFHGVFSSFVLPRGLGFDVEWVGQSLHQQASVPQGMFSLVIFLESKGRAIFNGQELNSLDTYFLKPGATLDLRTPPGATIAVVTIPKQVLEDGMADCEEPTRLRSGADATLLLDASAYSQTLEPALHPLIRAVETGTDLRSDPLVAELIATGLIETATMLVQRRDDPVDCAELGTARRRLEAFRSAREAIDQLDCMDLSISKLCRVAGVSRRTLEYCFEEAVATSPMQYLKLKKLNAVRHELRNAAEADTTIGDVAAKYGIWHLGRLSKEYGQLFGELPSATLRRRKSSSGKSNAMPIPR